MRYKVEWGFGVPEWMPLEKETSANYCLKVASGSISVFSIEMDEEEGECDYTFNGILTQDIQVIASRWWEMEYVLESLSKTLDKEYVFNTKNNLLKWAMNGFPKTMLPPTCMAGDLRVGEPFIYSGELHVPISITPDEIKTIAYRESEIAAFCFGNNLEVQPLGAGGWFKVEVLP